MKEESRPGLPLGSIVSHDLRTPLVAITGYAELLRTRDDERTRREAPQRILEAATRLTALVEDVAAVLEIETGELVLQREPVELEPLVAEAVADALVDDGPATIVRADRERLRRLLAAVVASARASASREEDVRVSVARAGGMAVVVASYAGPAPPEGLGLHLARRLAEIHGGGLWIETGAEAGTRLGVEIPLAQRP